MLEETGTPAESPLPPAILRGLGYRSYDKRKTAALDVTSLIKSLQEAGEWVHEIFCIVWYGAFELY